MLKKCEKLKYAERCVICYLQLGKLCFVISFTAAKTASLFKIYTDGNKDKLSIKQQDKTTDNKDKRKNKQKGHNGKKVCCYKFFTKLQNTNAKISQKMSFSHLIVFFVTYLFIVRVLHCMLMIQFFLNQRKKTIVA